jgi:hypothetical protein
MWAWVKEHWILSALLGLTTISAVQTATKKSAASFPVIPGHLYSLSYLVGPNLGQGAAPTQAAAQAMLDKCMPGLWNVVTTQASAMAGNFIIGATYDGPIATNVKASSLTGCFGAGSKIIGMQDMGGAPKSLAAA